MSPAGVTRRGITEIFRQERRRLLLLAVLVPVLTLAGAAAAEATTFKVNTTSDKMTSHDGKCSLREAIDAANSPGTKSDCGKAGTFSNLIVLRAKTYQLSIPPAATDTDQNCIAPPGRDASGVWRIFDIWETREHAERFYEQRVMPIVSELMQQRDDMTPPDVQDLYELHDVVRG